MNSKLTVIGFIVLIAIIISTITIANMKPQMHKTLMLEQIIYKRSK